MRYENWLNLVWSENIRRVSVFLMFNWRKCVLIQAFISLIQVLRRDMAAADRLWGSFDAQLGFISGEMKRHPISADDTCKGKHA